MKLPYSFYRQSDVCKVARELLGKQLCTHINGTLCSGLIVETEAYAGINDRACHAYNGKRTRRTEVFYEAGGVAYVYLCYGMHHLFNIITNIAGKPDAVLIRAVEPQMGKKAMLKRRDMANLSVQLTNGPAKLAQAMGINTVHTGIRLTDRIIWIEEAGSNPKPSEIVSTTRIGIDYAGADALKLWRFYLKENKWVSRF